MTDPWLIRQMVKRGEICEIRYLGKACEVRISIGPVLQFDEKSGMVILPGDVHVRHRDILSLTPLDQSGQKIRKDS